MLLMFLLTMFSCICALVYMAFFFFGNKEKWDSSSKSVFECGFTSYFFSRHSFSVHYFMISLTFLFLDLEICFILPFFLGEISSEWAFLYFFSFSLILTMMMIMEWYKGMLEWKS